MNNINEYPHVILELANFHGGKTDLIKKIISVFSELEYENLGIKFQAFKFDKIALKDYDYYPLYKELFIVESKWKQIISLSKKRKFKVWLDIFCLYGVQIFQENFKNVDGIKLQASILDNYEIFDALKLLSLSEKLLIINISGYEISDIEKMVSRFSSLNFKNIILQLGFQVYPTLIEDSSLKKIALLKTFFPNISLAYADHLDASSFFSRRFPIYAYLKGCNYLEKHVCLSRKEAEYDYASALEYDELEDVLTELKSAAKCEMTPFITKSEKKYLEETLQVPIINKNLANGKLVSKSDLIYRRSSQKGLKVNEIMDLQKENYILNQEGKEGSALQKSFFKKAKVAVIVAARMKSNRLRGKAIAKIQGISSIKRCLESCLKFNNVDQVILATSTLKEDYKLQNFLPGGVLFCTGHPDDVIRRYLDICDKYNIDVVIRVTGDCPIVSSEIADFLLMSHFEKGADFTCVEKCADGTQCEIYNVEVLRRVASYFKVAKHSEYMTWYIKNNSDIFNVNVVDLPNQWIRNYRLSLDYQEDLDLFNKLFQKLNEDGLDPTIGNIFSVLDNNPDIANINMHRPLIYEVDYELIDMLNRETRISLR